MLDAIFVHPHECVLRRIPSFAETRTRRCRLSLPTREVRYADCKAAVHGGYGCMDDARDNKLFEINGTIMQESMR